MSNDLERVLLGSLIMTPSLLEASDLRADDFLPGRHRQVFEGICSFWEDRRPETIDILLLADQLADQIGGDGIAAFVSGLLDGLAKSKPEMFQDRVIELRRRRLSIQIVKLAGSLASIHLKTGAFDPDDFEKLRQLVLEEGTLTGIREAFSLAERDPRSVKIRPISYLWDGVVPTHMATSVTGDAGEGKTLVTVDMSARVSRGLPFPIYRKAQPAVRGHVFYITSEGVPEMILVPRLIAAEADLGKITIIEGIHSKSGDFSMFDVTKHLPMIARRAQNFPDLKLIVFDPVASFIPERINTNQQNQVRQMMDRIGDLAYKLGVATVTVMHFSKAPGVRAQHKTTGSVQFHAAVKMSWSVVRREDDPRNTRLLVPQKSNITGGYKSLALSIHEANIVSPDDPKATITTARIKYDANLIDENPESLISPPIENDNHVASALRFLKRKLAEGNTLYAGPLIDEAETNGIPKWALYKAKDRLGVQHDKEGQFQGRTFWFLPKGKQ